MQCREAEVKHNTNSYIIPVQDIASVYQIFSDEVLGSGQFGIVYGGMFQPGMDPHPFYQMLL